MERLWAGWRSEYVESADNAEGCVLCRVLDADSHVVWRGSVVAAILNAFPYTSGHLMVLPVRHVGEIEELGDDESAEVWRTLRAAVVALKAAYSPHGLNVGVNIGRVAGAGVPSHFHVHALPRWDGDTNFMTSVAETRVLPEALSVTLEKLKAAWPA